MYGGGKGIADSALPYKRTPPSWLKTSSEDVQDQGAFITLAIDAVSRDRSCGCGALRPPLKGRKFRIGSSDSRLQSSTSPARYNTVLFAGALVARHFLSSLSLSLQLASWPRRA